MTRPTARYQFANVTSLRDERYLVTRMATTTMRPDTGRTNFPQDGSLPGEHFEVRQTHPTGDYTPDPSKSLPLSPARQALLDDIIALYEMRPTVERVKRYTPDCVYNDQFVYANDRYKMAGQWFALPKLFKSAKSHGCQVVTNNRDLIQFRHEEVCLVGSVVIFPCRPLPSPPQSFQWRAQKADPVANLRQTRRSGPSRSSPRRQ